MSERGPESSRVTFGVWLKHRVEHPMLSGYEEIGHHGFYPKFKLTKPDQIDDELRGFIAEAYKGGRASRPPLPGILPGSI